MASAYVAAYSSVVEVGQQDYFISGGSKFIEMCACCCVMFCFFLVYHFLERLCLFQATILT